MKKASRCPFSTRAGFELEMLSGVTRWSWLPSAFRTQIALTPSRPDPNAIWLPSGDQAGVESPGSLLASGDNRVCRLPSAPMT
jgi:hypothetical protein